MITTKLRGQEQVEKFLKSLPHGSMVSAIKAMAEYILGNTQHGLRHYPPYKKVTRAMAYGRSFVSDKQRRFFFWALRNGNIKVPYERTQTLQNGWQLSSESDPYRRTLFNRVPYAKHVMSDTTQSRMSQKIGWRTMSKVIADNIKGGMLAASQAVGRWLKARESGQK